jgi:hypothetical protein
LIEPGDEKDRLKELCHFVATKRFEEFPAVTVERIEDDR